MEVRSAMTKSAVRPGRVTLFVGTRKGLFRLHSPLTGREWSIDGPHIAGYEILHTCEDTINPDRIYAAANHSIWGAHIYLSTDGGTSWSPLVTAPYHHTSDYDMPVRGIWYLTHDPSGRLYAGIDPPGLFYSDDEGGSWDAVTGLNHHPSRATWEPARGGFSVHSVYVDPTNPDKIYAAVSAGGAYRSGDGGTTWMCANTGVRAENLPQRFPESGHNIHRLVMHPVQTDRLYRQCYNGTYRSDDGARNWIEITAGLPSDFGYAISVSRADSDTVFQIPESSSHMRATVDGRLRVYRSRDGGGSWTALDQGLPQRHAYVTVLREALDTDDHAPAGVYFGTSSGHVFASRDAGDHWQLIRSYLPRILSVKAVTS
jgi:hypothetical protein